MSRDFARHQTPAPAPGSRLPPVRPFAPVPPSPAAPVQRSVGAGHSFGRIRVDQPGARTATPGDSSAPIQAYGPVRRRRTRTSGYHPYARRTTYRPGQHGYKTQEQRRLTGKFGSRVSGATHQSEHPIGFEVINRTSGLPRGGTGLPRGSSDRKRVRDLENLAPAYQEEHQLHRDHIGTGSRGTVGPHGWNAQTYRDDQRTALEAGDPALAVQLNQLGYAFDPNFQSSSGTAKDQADDSYQTMVQNFPGFSYARGTQNVQVGVTQRQKAEMHLAREVARGSFRQNRGGFPSKQQENQVRRLYGLPELED